MSAPDQASPAWSVLPSTEELLARHRQVVARTPSKTATSTTGCTRSASLEHKKETAGFGQELAAHYVLLRQQRDEQAVAAEVTRTPTQAQRYERKAILFEAQRAEEEHKSKAKSGDADGAQLCLQNAPHLDFFSDQGASRATCDSLRADFVRAEELHVSGSAACDVRLQEMDRSQRGSLFCKKGESEKVASIDEILQTIADEQKKKAAAAEAAHAVRVLQKQNEKFFVAVETGRAKEAAKTQASLKKVVLRWKALELKLPFQLWLSKVDEIQRFEQIAGKVIRRWQNMTLILSFAAWTRIAADGARLKQATLLIIRRWDNICTAAPFRTWARAVEETVRLRGAAAMVLRRWNNLILVRPFEAWATMLVKPDRGGEQWEETETENHAKKPSEPASSDMISSSPNPRYRNAGDELLTSNLMDSTHYCWVDGEIGEEQNDMESSSVSRTLDACATKLRTVYCETCAHLSQAATACQNCEHVRELHFGQHFHDGAELTKVEQELLESKQTIFAGAKKAEKSDKTKTETRCEKLWIDEEREKEAKLFERTQRKQAETARQILLEKEEQLRVDEARRLQEQMRAERDWEEKRAKFKFMQSQRERDYAQRRDEFLKSRKLEKSLDYAQSYVVGCRGSLTQGLQTHGLVSLSHSSRADLQPERSLASAPPLSSGSPPYPESNSKRMYMLDSQMEPHHDQQSSTGSRNSIGDNIDGRCSQRRVAAAPSNMSISNTSHPKVTRFDAQVLQSRGLSSYSISSHRQDEKGQGGGHGIQQTFSKLDRANSIMERLLNAHLIGDPALTGMRAMRKTQLKIDYAAACEQPVSLDVRNRVRPIGPSQPQAVAERLKLAELCRYVTSVLERNPGGCVGWFLSLDSDADGEVSTQDLVERLQQLPCALSEQQALEFVAGVMWRGRDIAGESRHPRRVQLSELWIALNIPDNLYLQTNGVIRDSSAIKHTSNFCPSSRAQANESLAWFHPKVGHCSMDGNSHLRAVASCDKVYEDSMPGMTHDEFHREVRSMSELAARALSGVLQRQATLLHDIRKAKNNLCG